MWTRWGLLVAYIALGFIPSVQAAERVFTPSEIVDWPVKSFSGKTDYDLVQKDGRAAVHASCTEDTSSGLYLRQEIDLTKTPVIEWSWRVRNTYGAVDETKKAGDDYPARIYVVDGHSILPWRTRALSYVWSSAMPKGADWTNAYADQVHMVAVDAGEEGLGTWKSYRRNLRADFQRYHDRQLDNVDAIAIMSDCDDTGKNSEAWFGEIRLHSE